jgi:hypothetical protein
MRWVPLSVSVVALALAVLALLVALGR